MMSNPYGSPADPNQQPDPNGQPAQGNPYQSSPEPYGQPAPGTPSQSSQDPYAQQASPAYGSPSQPAYTPQSFAGGPNPYAEPFNKTQAIVLMVVGFLCTGWIPMIFGIVALVKGDSDPDGARKFVKWGWIVAAICFVLIIIFGIISVVASAGSASAGY